MKKGYAPFPEDDAIAHSQRLILRVSYLSILLNIVFFMVGLGLFVTKKSPASLAFSVACFLDFLSSFVLVWRYSGSPTVISSNERERKACELLGAMFIFVALVVLNWSVAALVTGQIPEWCVPLLATSTSATVACTLLAGVKLWLWNKLRSQSLLLDVNSLMGSTLGLVVILGDLAFLEDSRIWYLDPALSIGLALFMALYGFLIIVKQGDHNEQPSIVKQGDHNEQPSSR